METEKEYSIEFYEMTDPKKKKYTLVGTGFIKLIQECVEDITFKAGDGAFKVPCFEATLLNTTYPKLQKLVGYKNVIYKRFNRTYCETHGWTLTSINDTGYDDDIQNCVIAKQALDAYLTENNFQFKNILDKIMEKMGIKLEISYLETYRVKLNGIYWGQLEQNCSTLSNFVFQKVFRNDLGSFDQPLGCFINDQIRENGTPTGSQVHILLMSIYILLFIFYSYQRGDLILDVQGCISIETNKITLILTDPIIIIDPELTQKKTFYRMFYDRYNGIIELVEAQFSKDIIIEDALTDFIKILSEFLREWSHKAMVGLKVDMPDMSKLLDKCDGIRRFTGTVSKTTQEIEADAKRAIKIAHHDGRRVDVITPAVDVAEAERRRRVAAAAAAAADADFLWRKKALAERERIFEMAVEEERLRVAAVEEMLKKAAAEADAEKKRIVAAEEERLRKLAEWEEKKKAEEEERLKAEKKKAEEEERRRKAEEAEAKRKAEEEERRRKAEEAEAKRKAEEEERKRKEEEERLNVEKKKAREIAWRNKYIFGPTPSSPSHFFKYSPIRNILKWVISTDNNRWLKFEDEERRVADRHPPPPKPVWLYDPPKPVWLYDDKRDGYPNRKEVERRIWATYNYIPTDDPDYINGDQALKLYSGDPDFMPEMVERERHYYVPGVADDLDRMMRRMNYEKDRVIGVEKTKMNDLIKHQAEVYKTIVESFNKELPNRLMEYQKQNQDILDKIQKAQNYVSALRPERFEPLFLDYNKPSMTLTIKNIDDVGDEGHHKTFSENLGRPNFSLWNWREIDWTFGGRYSPESLFNPSSSKGIKFSDSRICITSYTIKISDLEKEEEIKKFMAENDEYELDMRRVLILGHLAAQILYEKYLLLWEPPERTPIHEQKPPAETQQSGWLSWMGLGATSAPVESADQKLGKWPAGNKEDIEAAKTCADKALEILRKYIIKDCESALSRYPDYRKEITNDFERCLALHDFVCYSQGSYMEDADKYYRIKEIQDRLKDIRLRGVRDVDGRRVTMEQEQLVLNNLLDEEEEEYAKFFNKNNIPLFFQNRLYSALNARKMNDIGLAKALIRPDELRQNIINIAALINISLALNSEEEMRIQINRLISEADNVEWDKWDAELPSIQLRVNNQAKLLDEKRVLWEELVELNSNIRWMRENYGVRVRETTEAEEKQAALQGRLKEVEGLLAEGLLAEEAAALARVMERRVGRWGGAPGFGPKMSPEQKRAKDKYDFEQRLESYQSELRHPKKLWNSHPFLDGPRTITDHWLVSHAEDEMAFHAISLTGIRDNDCLPAVRDFIVQAGLWRTNWYRETLVDIFRRMPPSPYFQANPNHIDLIITALVAMRVEANDKHNAAFNHPLLRALGDSKNSFGIYFNEYLRYERPPNFPFANFSFDKYLVQAVDIELCKENTMKIKKKIVNYIDEIINTNTNLILDKYFSKVIPLPPFNGEPIKSEEDELVKDFVRDLLDKAKATKVIDTLNYWKVDKELNRNCADLLKLIDIIKTKEPIQVPFVYGDPNVTGKKYRFDGKKINYDSYGKPNVVDIYAPINRKEKGWYPEKGSTENVDPNDVDDTLVNETFEFTISEEILKIFDSLPKQKADEWKERLVSEKMRLNDTITYYNKIMPELFIKANQNSEEPRRKAKISAEAYKQSTIDKFNKMINDKIGLEGGRKLSKRKLHNIGKKRSNKKIINRRKFSRKL
jgi:hypothetical protein